MYKVLVADDEPAAVLYIVKLIELKCPGFEVAGTAANGREILEILKEKNVDVVVSDIQMQKMDGISLVTFLHEKYPYIHSVIVSGYQDFQYAKDALKAEVEDYLVKPVAPREMQQLFEGLRRKLDASYYRRRNYFLHCMGSGETQIKESELKNIFPACRYYGAVIRKNGLVSRFDPFLNQEIFSVEDEQIIIYGRDSREMLYLYPEELIYESFCRMMDHEFDKQKEEGAYLTMVVCREAFDNGEIPHIVQSLYQMLDNSIVIGEEQKIFLGEGREFPGDTDKAVMQFNRMLRLIEMQEYVGLTDEFSRLMAIWEDEKKSQFYVENKVRYLFYEMKNSRFFNGWDEYWVEDAFSDVVSMKELCINIQDILRQYGKVELAAAKKEDREIIFDRAVNYMKEHLQDKLSVQTLCQQIGVSRATLNRLFRMYGRMPYNNYVVKLRIEMAKSIMEQYPESYIKDIAEQTGFSDQFYFSRVFRSVVGMSPSGYMEQFAWKENKEEQKE